MKRIRFHHVVGTLAVMLFAVGLFFPDNLSAFYGGLHAPLGLTTPVVDLGDVPAGKKTTRQVTFLNSHASMVKINEVSTSCGCTAATTSADAIAALHSGTLVVSITPRSVGRGGESIELNTNHGTQQIVVRYNAV